LIATVVDVSAQPATAATLNKKPSSASQIGPAHETDICAARRRSYRRGNCAAVGAFFGIVGTMASIAAAA